jgi:RNA polymerase sigma-70 factor (ECF subfamily)
VNEVAERLAGRFMTVEDDLTREFEARLAESSTLAIRVAYSVVRHRQDAEDVAQEAFARAHRKFASLRDRDRFRAWLVRMTWRLALDHRRGARRRLQREEAVLPNDPSPGAEDAALARERAARLWAAIDALPEKLRLVIVLAAIDEQSIRDVATLLGAPEGTIKSRLFEARKQLQEMLR